MSARAVRSTGGGGGINFEAFRVMLLYECFHVILG